ncbi:MAG TPA: hypothetical protein VGG61_07775, partial [Gemmataceae bacterium]
MLLAGLALCFSFLTTVARADTDDAELRKQALALNDVTGDQPMRGKIVALVDDPANSKKLLAVAARIAKDAKDKEQPFNYNAAYILARTGRELKESDVAEQFYHLCIDQGKSLKSGFKIAVAFDELTILLFQNKKYDECEKICQEFLEINGDDTIKLEKPRILRRLIMA